MIKKILKGEAELLQVSRDTSNVKVTKKNNLGKSPLKNYISLQVILNEKWTLFQNTFDSV